MYNQFITDELHRIKAADENIQLTGDIKQDIKRRLLFHKFRKYSVSAEYIKTIETAINYNVDNNLPINITFPHGGYKLWRLPEAPEADWAELFSHMYYTEWLAPICKIYAPGVLLDYYLDDIIICKLNNISRKDIEAYISSYKKVIKFLKHYQPKNLYTTVTTVSSRFASESAFWNAIGEKLETQPKPEEKGLSANMKRMIELNCKLKSGQEADPLWRQKIACLHDAYLEAKRATGYIRGRDDKIMIATNLRQAPRRERLVVGSTKTSTMKFWIACGALLKTGNRLQTTVLSQSQLEKHSIETVNVSIPGLIGKNFDKIRIVSLKI
ncbi:MAG: hypothetical protein FWE53_02475 [Firmicutes bacterium]|nr:hypothetical protein [Bacillota bacterium]